MKHKPNSASDKLDTSLPPELAATLDDGNNPTDDVDGEISTNANGGNDGSDFDLSQLEKELENELANQHHLTDVAQEIWRDNIIFTRQCLWNDIDLQKFLWQFLHLSHMQFSRLLPLARCYYEDIRENIGNKTTEFLLIFIFDSLVKYHEATKIPQDNSTNNYTSIMSNAERKRKENEAKQKSIIFKWIKFIKDLFTHDVASAYQFLYLISHKKSYWLMYILECDLQLVRELIVDAIITAMKSILELERPYYYVKIENWPTTASDDDDNSGGNMESNNNNTDVDTVVTTQNTESKTDEAQKIERKFEDLKPMSRLKWFESSSVIVTVLDEMCRNMLIAHPFWRNFDEFWLFFKLFAELGSPERQLLLEKYMITECIRFYNQEKRPFRNGLQLLIRTEKDELDHRTPLSEKQKAFFIKLTYEEQKREKDLKRKMENERLYYHKIGHKRVTYAYGKKMGNDNVEPGCSHMVEMLKLLVCSCAPPTLLKQRKYANKNLILKCDANMLDIKYSDYTNATKTMKYFGDIDSTINIQSLLYGTQSGTGNSTISNSPNGGNGSSRSNSSGLSDNDRASSQGHKDSEYYRLPATTDVSVLNENTRFLEMHSDDKKYLIDPNIFKHFIQDGQNPQCVAQILCHLSWMNDRYLKECCKMLVTLVSDTYATSFEPIFVCIREFLKLDDYKEIGDYISGQSLASMAQLGNMDALTSEDEESDVLSGLTQSYNPGKNGGYWKDVTGLGVKYELKVFSSVRIERIMRGLIRIIRDDLRSSEDLQESRKLTEFLDELIQTNKLVAMWFRNNINRDDVAFFREHVRMRYNWLSVAKGPELP